MESPEGESAEKKVDDKKADATPKPSADELKAIKARQTAEREADRATTVVASFLKQANDGVYSKATEYLSPAVKKYFDSEISAVNGTQKGVLDELTGNGTISMVTYVNTTVRGEGAVVDAELGYQNGQTTRRSFDLIRLEDEWKIVLPVSGNGNKPVSAVAPAVSATPAPAPLAAPGNPGSLSAAVEKAASAAAVPAPAAEQAPQVPLVVAPPQDAAATTAPQ